MNEKQIKYILEEIKKANHLSEIEFDHLYRLNEKKYSKTIFRLTEINEILTNLEINLEIVLGIDEESLKGGNHE